MTPETKTETNPNVFHDHLDVCKQCREQPFNLCDIGSNALLKAVGRENDPQHTRPPDPDLFDFMGMGSSEKALFSQVMSDMKGPVGDFFRFTQRR